MGKFRLVALLSLCAAAGLHGSVIYTVENAFTLTTSNYIQSGFLQFGAATPATSGLGSNYRSSSCLLQSFTCWQANFFEGVHSSAPPGLQNYVAIQFIYLTSDGEQHWSEYDFPGASLTEDGVYYQYPWSSDAGVSLVVHDPVDPPEVDAAAAPEPATWGMFGAGIGTLLLVGRKRSRSSRSET